MSIFAIFGKKSLLNKPASIKMDDISMSYMWGIFVNFMISTGVNKSLNGRIKYHGKILF
jgi:hypothetical protein